MAKPQVVRTSEMVAEMKPVWAKFIVNLGYTKKQGETFAEGYASELSKLPILGKMRALEVQDDRCMTAGFKAAEIDEDEALERSQSGVKNVAKAKERGNGKKTVPAFPNSFPYNELLLQGKLSAKTRTWRWSHTGLTLLYTSTSTAHDVAAAHGLNPKGTSRGVLVGVGELVPVRELTSEEADQIEREFDNNTGTVSIGAGTYRYEFKNLKRFKKPIPFKPPQGAVRLFNVPVSVVAKALKEVGVSV